MMRRLLILLALAGMGCGGRGSAPRLVAEKTTPAVRSDSAAAGIVFDERVHDFGTVLERDGVMAYRFRFTNRGKQPVVATQALTSCQCIGAEFSREPVGPGGEGFVTVSYDPNHRPGSFSTEIRILFDGGRTVCRIWIRGEVIPFRHPVAEDHPYGLGLGLRSNLKVLLLGGIRPGERGGILFRYGNASQDTMRLRFRVEGATRQALTLPDTALLGPEDRREVRIAYRMGEGLLGAQRLRIIPEVNGRALTPLELIAVALPPKRPVTATSPVVECRQRNFLFERDAEPQPFAITLGNRGASPLHILQVDLPRGVESELRAGMEIATGESRTFDASLRTTTEYHDRLYVITDDPVRPCVTITLNTKNEENR